MIAGPQAVVTELGGRDRRAQREHPAVVLDLLGLLLGELGEAGEGSVALLGHRLGLGDEVGVRGIGERVAPRVAGDVGAAGEGVVGGLAAGAAERVGGDQAVVVGSGETGVGRGHRTADRGAQRSEADEDGDRGQAAEERAPRAGVALRLAATGTGRQDRGRGRGRRLGPAAGAAAVRTVVTHEAVALPVGDGGGLVRRQRDGTVTD